MNTIQILFSLFTFTFTSLAVAQTYVIDASHSSVVFKVRHLMGKVPGRFEKFEGTFDYAPKKSNEWKVKATLNASSVNTNHVKRDEHLKGPDFFNIKKFPTLTFESIKVIESGENQAKIEGTLTLLGVTKPVVLETTLNGLGKDPWGNERIGISAKTKINRKDFGMVYNKVLDAGGLMLGDDVDVELEIEGVAKK